MLRIKLFGNVKKHDQRNASADALNVCTIVMPGKAIWHRPIQEAQLSPSDRAMRLVSIVILPIATQQCRNHLYDKSWPN